MLPLNVDPQQIFLHLLNFTILFGVLYFLLYSPVKKFMDNRTDEYKRLDDEARQNSDAAKKARQEYDDKLASADAEIEKRRQEARRALSEQNERSIADAKRRAERIISDANAKAENDRRKLISSAESEIADMVADATERLVLKSSASESYDSFLEAALGGAEDE